MSNNELTDVEMIVLKAVKDGNINHDAVAAQIGGGITAWQVRDILEAMKDGTKFGGPLVYGAPKFNGDVTATPDGEVLLGQYSPLNASAPLDEDPYSGLTDDEISVLAGTAMEQARAACRICRSQRELAVSLLESIHPGKKDDKYEKIGLTAKSVDGTIAGVGDSLTISATANRTITVTAVSGVIDGTTPFTGTINVDRDNPRGRIYIDPANELPVGSTLELQISLTFSEQLSTRMEISGLGRDSNFTKGIKFHDAEILFVSPDSTIVENEANNRYEGTTDVAQKDSEGVIFGCYRNATTATIDVTLSRHSGNSGDAEIWFDFIKNLTPHFVVA